MGSDGQNLESREHLLARLVGIQSSKLNYYSELKQKLAELEQKNILLQQAKGTTDALYERSRLQTRRLDQAISSLESISHALTTTTQGVDVLLQTIIGTIAKMFECSFVLLLSDDCGCDPCIVYYPLGPPAVALRDDLLKIMPRLTQYMTSTLRPARINLTPDGNFVVDEENGHFLCVLMLREGTLVGAICMQLSAAMQLDQYHLAQLHILANQAAIAIQNAQLFEESQHLKAKAEELYRLALEQKDEAERKRRELQAALAEIDTMEREQIISAERERIARELHDSVAQILTSIGINLEWCRQHLPPDSSLLERFVLLKGLARNGLFEIRSAILSLSSPGVAEVGLVAALERLVGDFEKIARITTSFATPGEICRLDPDIEDALYHVCQEALHNIFKHAQASQVMVSLNFTLDELTLTITDDGLGIDPRAVEQIGQRGVTFGLNNMFKRTAELGGTLWVNRLNGKGTRLIARIPLKKEERYGQNSYFDGR
jgi:signal transduction histidine kinase